MSRPSKNTDQKLIQAALDLLPETGYSGLKMRAVAKRAGVNLGMFHYYFRDKADFQEKVASEFYEKFYQAFTLEAAEGKTAREQLQNAINELVRFGRENRKLVLALAKDVLANYQPTVRLLEKFIPRHGVVLVRLVRQCQREGLIAKVPLPTVMFTLMMGIFGPIVLLTILEMTTLKAPYDWVKKLVLPLLLSDHMVDQRMQLLFRALTPSPELEKMNQGEAKQINAIVDKVLANDNCDFESLAKAELMKAVSPKRRKA